MNGMRVNLIGLCLVMIYLFLATYVLQELHWLGLVGGTFASAVLLSPVLFFVGRTQRSILPFILYSAAGLVGACAAYAITLRNAVPSHAVLGLVLAFAIYPIPILAAIAGIAIVLNRPVVEKEASAKRLFSYKSAWLALAAAVLLAESYWFGFSVKSCQGFFWGVLGIMESPFFLIFKPAINVVLAAVFFCGGFLPENVRISRAATLVLVAISCIATATIAAIVTPSSQTFCSAP